MHHISAIASAGRHVSKLAFLGAISTVVAAAGTTWLVTGSSDPYAWIADYKHALQCAVADPALNTKCFTVAAVPAVAVVQAPERSAPDHTPPSAEPPATALPSGPQAPEIAPAPAPAAYEPEDGGSDESDS